MGDPIWNQRVRFDKILKSITKTSNDSKLPKELRRLTYSYLTPPHLLQTISNLSKTERKQLVNMKSKEAGCFMIKRDLIDVFTKAKFKELMLQKICIKASKIHMVIDFRETSRFG